MPVPALHGSSWTRGLQAIRPDLAPSANGASPQANKSAANQGLHNAKRPEELPPELTAYIRDRKGYNYLHHAEVGSNNAEFVTDEVVDRFCIVGNVANHIQRLEELRSAGVTQFNIYLMCGEEESTLDVYGRDIVPKLL